MNLTSDVRVLVNRSAYQGSKIGSSHDSVSETDVEYKSDELRMQDDLHIYTASAKHWPITYHMNSARCDRAQRKPRPTRFSIQTSSIHTCLTLRMVASKLSGLFRAFGTSTTSLDPTGLLVASTELHLESKFRTRSSTTQ
jgi:hypothetical protein